MPLVGIRSIALFAIYYEKILRYTRVPPPDNCLNGEVDWVEVEAETEDEAKDKARHAVMHRIRVNRIKEISPANTHYQE
jgi:hypothetical protein